jgi:MFS family permease
MASARPGAQQGALIPLLVLGTMLPGMVLIPAVRPFIAAFHGGSEPAMHAFMSVNLLGAILGGPLVVGLAERGGARRAWRLRLALLDGSLLLACLLPLPIPLLLTTRAVQGAASMGVLSLLLGAVRGDAPGTHGRAMGLAGAAMMVAVALGAPLGTLLLSLGPAAPVLAGGALQLAVGFASLRVPASAEVTQGAMRPWRLFADHRPLALPTLWLAAERFTVGCFVVTFALFAHQTLGLSDAHVGFLYSCFLLPFALASYPLGRMAERVERGALVAAGSLLYGAMFMLLGIVPAAALPAVLLCAGVAAAAIYAPSLCLAATVVPPALRATSMSVVNAAGSLGMLLGTALAGILGSVLARRGWDRAESATLIFCIAGAVQLASLLITARGLRSLEARGEDAAPSTAS